MIFWNFGVHKLRLINFFLKFSIFILLFQLVLTVYLTPFSQEVARSLYRISNINFFDNFIKEKKFNDLIKNFTIHAESKDSKGNFKNIYLKRNLNENNFEVTYAKKGVFINNANKQFLILYDGQSITSNNGEITNFSFSQSNVNLSNYETETIKVIKTQENSTLDLFKCYLKLKKIDLINFNKNFNERNCSLKNLNNILKEIYKRIFIPLYIPSLILLSLILVTSSKEDHNYNRKKIIIFLAGFILMIIYETSLRYVANSFQDNFLLFSFPILLLIGLYSLISLKLMSNKK